MISDRSPKQFDRAHYIGNRGLGFRSILAWTDYPFILSGNLRLGFSSQRAARRLKALCQDNQALRSEVKQEQVTGNLLPIPILACPTFLDSGGLSNDHALHTSPDSIGLWQLASQIRSNGYDTVIAIAFTEADAYQQVLDQVKAFIKDELLLFLHSTKELIIKIGAERSVWKAERSENEVRIWHNDDESRASIWRIFVNRGTVPEEHLGKDQRRTPDFEIKIAVPLQAGCG